MLQLKNIVAIGQSIGRTYQLNNMQHHLDSLLEQMGENISSMLDETMGHNHARLVVVWLCPSVIVTMCVSDLSIVYW